MIRFLQQPGPAKKFVLSALLLLVIVTMVITLIPGVYDSLSGPGQGVLATVGKQQITSAEMDREIQQFVQQRGGRISSSAVRGFAPFFLQRAIGEKAEVVEAGRMGLRVTDDEVVDALRHGGLSAQLYPNGLRLDDQAYLELVNQVFGFVSIEQFEDWLREQLLVKKLDQLVAAGVTVSEAELRQEYEKRNSKVKLEYAVLTAEGLAKQLHPAEAELRAYFDKSKQRYNNAMPEMRRVRYTVADTSKLEGEEKPTSTELERYYNQHKSEFRIPERIKVRHILIKTPAPDAQGEIDPKGLEAARAKADGVLKQLQAGASFEALARKYSQDSGSAANGGALPGWITSESGLVPEFKTAAFALNKGQTSGLVRTSYGFHIIRVDDKQPAHVQTLEEVNSQVEARLRKEKAGRDASALANTLESEGRSLGLDKAAARHGLEVHATAWVRRSDLLPDVGASPEFMEAVFSARPKSAPEIARTAQGFALFEVTEMQPPRTPKFEEIRSQVENDFKQERAASLLAQKTRELADRAHALHDVQKAAKELGATVKTSGLLGPDQQAPDLGSMSDAASVAFSLKVGEVSDALNLGSTGVVLKVLERQEPSPAGFDKSKDQLREQVLERKRTQMVEVMIENLRDRLEKQGQIKINRDELNRFTGGRAAPART